MVCVETGNVADDEVRLAADGEHQMSAVISRNAGRGFIGRPAQLGGEQTDRHCS
jgi:hypothetical protein